MPLLTWQQYFCVMLLITIAYIQKGTVLFLYNICSLYSMSYLIHLPLKLTEAKCKYYLFVCFCYCLLTHVVYSNIYWYHSCSRINELTYGVLGSWRRVAPIYLFRHSVNYFYSTNLLINKGENYKSDQSSGHFHCLQCLELMILMVFMELASHYTFRHFLDYFFKII